jgi:carbamoyltransferase
MDLAASIQSVTEEAVVRLARSSARATGAKRLCLAGGVALNCVANGRVWRDGAFQSIWIQPAAGDAGGALGAALAAYYQFKGQPRVAQRADAMQGAFLGPHYAQADCEARLRAAGARFEVLNEDALIDVCAHALAAGQAVGWFQGRMEFGPRALGARSILGDPRSPTMQSVLNLKIKYRESFRPFAPSVLRERVADWFELDADSPYMLLVAHVKGERRVDSGDDAALFGIDRLKRVRSQIPAATHVDHSARVQTVHRETNPRYHALLLRFEALTGCPVVVNTSFNVRGEPIVCTPEDAFRCFMGTGIDLLAVENCVLRKDEQDVTLLRRYDGELAAD